MIGLRTQHFLWPLTAIATLGAALGVQACSGKVQQPSDCANASCGGAFGASGSKAEGGSAAVSGLATDGGSGPMVNTCSNGSKDPDEADVDCGGRSHCDRCTQNAKCAVNSDCETQYCKSGRCSEPTCTDKVKNQDETGVDCGGPCLPCDLGAPCASNNDCEGQYCANDVCADHCLSKVRESDETDLDCGGSTCKPCADNRKCDQGSDCQSGSCSKGRCVSATCTDQVQNQDETDVDCGGVCSSAMGCAIGKHCKTAADCDSYVCSGGKCAADLLIPAADVIDDFEDSDLLLPTPARAGRVGNWYLFNDGSGAGTFNVLAIDRGASSTDGLRVAGKDFSTWGSGLGVDFNSSAGGQATKAPYDASAYSAVTFWARALNPTDIKVTLPDVDTDAAGNTCSLCSHHYYKTVSVTATWQRFTVSFSELALEAGGSPVPSAFKPSALISLQFMFPLGASYDVTVDDVAFIK